MKIPRYKISRPVIKFESSHPILATIKIYIYWIFKVTKVCNFTIFDKPHTVIVLPKLRVYKVGDPDEVS